MTINEFLAELKTVNDARDDKFIVWQFKQIRARFPMGYMCPINAVAISCSSFNISQEDAQLIMNAADNSIHVRGAKTLRKKMLHALDLKEI